MAQTAVKLGLAACLTVMGVAVALLTVEYDSPRLGNRLLALASEQAGINATVAQFKLAPLTGLVLEDFEATTAVDGGSLSVRVDSLILRHRFWPLLAGQLMVDEVVLSSPHLKLVALEAPETRGVPEPASDSAESPTSNHQQPSIGINVGIEELRIADATVLVLQAGSDDPEQAVTRIAGLDLVFEHVALSGEHSDLLLAVKASGSMTAEEFVTERMVATEVESRVDLTDGHLVLSGLDFESEFGEMKVPELDLDLTRDPLTFDLVAEGPRLDLSSTLGVLGEGLGDVALELASAGDLSETMNLEGSGRLVFTSGRVPESKLLRGVQRLLPGVPLIGAEYEPFEIAFDLRESRVVFDTFELLMQQARLAGSGSVGLDLTLAVALESRFPRELLADTKEIPEEVLELLTDAEGMVHLPLLVTGDREHPNTAFDRSQWKQLATKRLRSEARNELGRQLGRLLGGSNEQEEQ